MPRQKLEPKKFKHTPGPWVIPDWRQLGRIDVCFPGDHAGSIIAVVCLRTPRMTEKGCSEEESNAALICAAPELLAACEALPLDCDFTDAADFKDNAEAFMRAMDLARAAIRKAKSIPK